SIIVGALVRAARLGRADAAASASAARLATRLLVERDGAGGYGSAQATRIVVRALVEASPADGNPTSIRWTEILPDRRWGASGRAAVGAHRPAPVPLSAAAVGVRVDVSRPGVVARVERPVLRSFLRPPEPGQSPLHLQVDAPSAPRARGTAVMHIGLRHD